MQVTLATDDAALADLWLPWRALWHRVPDALPFLSPAWLKPWWSAFGTGRPVVATLHNGNGLAGVLPLYRLGDKLLPIGVGVSDYFDVLLAPGAPPDAAQRLLHAALDAAGTGRCDLPELPQTSPLRDVAARASWRADAWRGPPCPALPLLPTPAIPKGMRRDLRQARNRAERAGGWHIDRADAASFPALLAALVQLHGARWRGRGEAGALADPAVLAFHHAAGPELLAAGLLRLEAVRVHDRIAAVIYALLSRDRIHFYLSGFDPGSSFESPGTILLGHMIETAAREGRREADFLRGDERYKYAWGGLDRWNQGRSFVRE
ncbi:MAG TPA: GNAT family N-acetyltransferase [Rhodopila sp.]|nr:GNAT family N-acetyltransferase [Rhodopila sp.]